MKAEHKVETMCRALKTSRSGFYDWRSRLENRHVEESEDKLLAEKVLEQYKESRGTYGHRSILEELKKKGVFTSRRKILKAMRGMALKAIPHRSKPYPKPGDMPEHKVCKNRLRRNFHAKKPNRIWVGDITYLWTGEGWLYLATVIDLYSRMVVGWAISDKPDTQLAVDALKDALANRTYRKWRLMFHSDQGCQYTSIEMMKFLKDHWILQSMSRRGQCWDNAAMESFFGTLKQETELGRWPLNTAEETKFAIFDWIECWYNVKRRHSKLGYCSPSYFESTTSRAA
jgi:putative transposase